MNTDFFFSSDEAPQRRSDSTLHSCEGPIRVFPDKGRDWERAGRLQLKTAKLKANTDCITAREEGHEGLRPREARGEGVRKYPPAVIRMSA